MKLLPTHLIDEEPKEDEFLTMVDSAEFYDENAFDDCHAAWTKRQVRPEWNDYPLDKDWKKSLAYYNENRLRYGGFDKHEFLVRYNFKNLLIEFRDDRVILWDRGKDPKRIYSGLITSTELFELICKENGIELEILTK